MRKKISFYLEINEIKVLFLKDFLILILIFILFFKFTKLIYADNNNFQVNIQTIYTVMPDGNTHIIQNTQVKNNTDYYYMPTYSLLSGIKDIKNIQAASLNGSIPYDVNSSGDMTVVNLTFPNKTIGKNKLNSFNISFDTSSIAKKSGDVWELNIPGLSNLQDFNSFEAVVNVPKNFSSPTIIKPFKIFDSLDNQFIFDKNEIGKAGIYMIFNQEQYYNYNFTYYISNPNLFPVKTEIALPASTNYQDVVITSLIPAPSEVYEDNDGNWLAVYNLGPQKKQNVNLYGTIKVMSFPKQEFLPTSKRLTYLEQKKFWEVNDPSIKKLSEELKTAKEIYNFVVNKLTYDYAKIAADDIPRKGAIKAFENPDTSVCLEFTDLFIGIARAAGIPSRSVEGYAYTQNSKLKPLSLTKDILHAWPEYYNDEKKTWIMIDPTWGNTTNGIDYFNTLDLEHVSFVIKGIDSSYPIPAGGYKDNKISKDVNISFAKASDFNPKISVILKDDIPTSYLSGIPLTTHITVKNTGNSEIKNKKVNIVSDFSTSPQNINIDSIPPYGSKSYEVKFGSSPFLTNKDYNIKILFEGTSINRKIKIGTVPDKVLLVIGGGLFVSLILIVTVAFKTRRLSVPR